MAKEFFEGKRYRFMAMSVSGAPVYMDSPTRDSEEVAAFLAAQSEAGNGVSVICSEWREEIFNGEFIPAN